MNIQDHTTPERLERYSFLWSEARLIIAAVALFLGGVPPLVKILGWASFTYTLLTLSWIISGIAAVFLGYKWYKSRVLFGGKENLDLLAFGVMVISGINLGLVPILGNIGMRIAASKGIFVAVGVLYLAAAYHLYRRWKANGEKIF